MSEIDWSRYPFVAQNDLGRRWLQIQCDLGLAQNTVEAYGRGLEEYLRFLRDLYTDVRQAGCEIIANYVSSLRARAGAARGNVISIDTKSSLSNTTLQQRLTVIRLFYDFLLEERLCKKESRWTRSLHSGQGVWFTTSARFDPALSYAAVDSQRGRLEGRLDHGSDEMHAGEAHVFAGL
jgi:hypothetical protein